MFASYLLEIGWERGQRLTPKVNGGGEIKGKVKGSPRGPPSPRVSPKGITCKHFPSVASERRRKKLVGETRRQEKGAHSSVRERAAQSGPGRQALRAVGA